ncbi:MAG TPA: response regulator [Xanthomonadaceae bacterium]
MSIFDSVRRLLGRDSAPTTPSAAAPAPARPVAPAPAPAAVKPEPAAPAPIPMAQAEVAAPAPAVAPVLAPSPDDVTDSAIEAAAEDHVPQDDSYQGPERRERNRVNARAGTRALIVDDSNVVVAVLRKMLQQNGFQTYEAYTAEEALELAKVLVPEIIFLDIVLPGMDGFAALRALRRDPVTKDVPVIMISGNMLATEQFYVQRIGADDFMKKPFSRPEVFTRIERLLDDEGIPRRVGMPAQAV